MSSRSYTFGEARPRAILVMGVAGSGKTTIARALATALGWAFHDGDDHHSVENVAKMSAGVPLTESDRAPWLATLHVLIGDSVRRDKPVVVACSALKQAHRDELVDGIDVAFVYLRADRELVRTRLQSRTGHYMRLEMLESQFDVLEEPNEAIVVDAAQDPETIVDTILAKLAVGMPRPSEDG